MPGVVQIASGIGIIMGHEDRLRICGFLPVAVLGWGVSWISAVSIEYLSMHQTW